MRTAVVSGVARPTGLGRQIARTFINKGYRVVGCDVLPEEAPDLRSSEPQASSNYSFLRVDVRRPEDVRALYAHVEQVAGGPHLHVLVNNAGIPAPFLDAADPLASWHNFIDTNLTGAFLMSHILQPLMEEGSSAIIHISSTRALQSEPGCEGYAAAKAGLLGLTHAQAASLQRRTRVNAVLPGWIDVSGGQEPISDAQHKWQLTGRVGKPEDVAELVAFLADERLSGYITGQHLVCDGGVTVKMHYPEE
ncbi:hypothetical protein Vretimale_10742 [Volvox reticuliferus]|uniref:Uncharacterized protein n=1 Tax=Volvox reticuliferus TaxID=1737510 RepID=A0A8J4GGJ5_9CHLO|nr:hypothetical protein Vretifemale_13894 [Volvox reticuliferus]GIM06420.1 hypothetical protein Vretimale_10742 [Volvox reticuliferus]